MQNSKSRSRNINIDIIKTLALFFVIGIHFFTNTEYYSLDYSVKNFFYIPIRNIVTSCVPLFLITTGYLCKNKTWNKKYYIGLVKVTLLYSFVIVIITYTDFSHLENFNIIKSPLVNILNYKYYGWYVSMYIGLMLIAPIFNIAFKNMENKTRKITVLNIILAITLPITIVDLFTNIQDSILAHLMSNWWHGAWPIMYYVIGLYFSYNKNTIKNLKTIFLGILILSTSVYFIFGVHEESTVFANIFIAGIASCIFKLILDSNFSLPTKIETILMVISKHTLPAYLLSYIVDSYIYNTFQIKVYMLYIPIVNFILTLILTIIFSLVLNLLNDLIKK